MTASAVRIIDFMRIPQRQHLQTPKDDDVAFDDIPDPNAFLDAHTCRRLWLNRASDRLTTPPLARVHPLG